MCKGVCAIGLFAMSVACSGRVATAGADGAVDTSEASDAAAHDTLVPPADIGWDVTFSPEPCPFRAQGVFSGFPCAVKGTKCRWACGEASRRNYIITALCQENGVWAVEEKVCADL